MSPIRLSLPISRYEVRRSREESGLNGLRFLSATSSNFLAPRHISLHMRMMFPELFEENNFKKTLNYFLINKRQHMKSDNIWLIFQFLICGELVRILLFYASKHAFYL